jgi:hypothetical protein
VPTRSRSLRLWPILVLAVALAALLLAAAAVAGTEITRKGNLQVKITGAIAPKQLPRTGTAPIAVTIGGQISTTDGTLPPQLHQMKVEINRNGRLDYRGLPVCKLHQIQPASSPRALAACRSSLVGRGTFAGYISLKGQEPYVTKGELLVFNGREGRRPVLFGHIFLSQPFASSFVITFDISNSRHGQFGTTLTANLSKVLGTRRYLTGIEMTLKRSFAYRGSRHSYLSSGCPAPKGIGKVAFPLMRASFDFASGQSLGSTLTGNCGVRG